MPPTIHGALNQCGGGGGGGRRSITFARAPSSTSNGVSTPPIIATWCPASISMACLVSIGTPSTATAPAASMRTVGTSDDSVVICWFAAADDLVLPARRGLAEPPQRGRELALLHVAQAEVEQHAGGIGGEVQRRVELRARLGRLALIEQRTGPRRTDRRPDPRVPRSRSRPQRAPSVPSSEPRITLVRGELDDC